MDHTEIAGRVLAWILAEGLDLSSDLTGLEAVVLEQVRKIGARAGARGALLSAVAGARLPRRVGERR